MKTSKCLMGVLLGAVLFIGSAFAGNTLHKDGIAVKDGFNIKGISLHSNNLNKPIVEPETRDACDDAGGNSLWVGDGWCDPTNNNEICNYDGGDCCPCTCYDNVDNGCPESNAGAGGCYAGEGVYDYCGDCATCPDGEGICPDECSAGECGDGTCGFDEDCNNCPADCGECGDCSDVIDPTYGPTVPDCSGDGDCCPEVWIGDGFEDCEDQQFGCDLTCYDNDGGDCGPACPDGQVECWDGSCAASEADCPDQPDVPGPEGVCIAGSMFDYYGTDTPAVTVTWDITTECGDGACNGDEDYYNCPDDCNAPGECANGEVADCDESGECWTETWVGDGYCDGTAQEYGADLCCYDMDGGDCTDAECEAACPDQSQCWDGSCVDDLADCPEQGGCAETFAVTGSDPSMGDCYTDGSGYFNFYWEGGCMATTITYSGGTIDIAYLGFTQGFLFYGFEPGSCEDFVMEFDTGESAAASACNDCVPACPGQVECWDGTCVDSADECSEVDCSEVIDPTYGATVEDCSGDGDCCPEVWIGDGFEDCEDQQYGCDLTCYDNDGGDCGPSESCADQGLVDCPDGSCAVTTDDCPEASCSDVGGIDSYISDGYCDALNNNEACSYDGGDCCESTCVSAAYDCDAATGPCAADICIDPDGNNDGCGGRSADYVVVKQIFKKGQAPLVSKAGLLAKLNAVPNFTSDYDGQAVRIGEIITSSSRDLIATVAFECIEGVNAGWTGSWDTDALAMGEFTVFGWDPSDYVCATVTFCEGAACSDSVGPVCAYAGDVSSSECAEDDGCDGAGSGDVNGDGSSDVLDIVQIVNVILGGSFADDCAAEAADINGDGSADVLDIVQIVNGILGRSDVGDATTGKLIRDNGALMLEANGGYIGGVQMTLSHGADFSIELGASSIGVAAYKTVGNETKLVIVAPEGEELFTYTGDFEIVDMIVANSEGRVNVGAPTAFSLSEAYPNPFNPTTSMTLAVPEAGNVSVQVYNIMGQVVATLASGHMDASTYTLTWDASNVSSGMYFVKAEAAGKVTTQKLVLMK